MGTHGNLFMTLILMLIFIYDSVFADMNAHLDFFLTQFNQKKKHVETFKSKEKAQSGYS